MKEGGLVENFWMYLTESDQSLEEISVARAAFPHGGLRT